MVFVVGEIGGSSLCCTGVAGMNIYIGHEKTVLLMHFLQCSLDLQIEEVALVEYCWTMELISLVLTENSTMYRIYY